MSDNNAIHLPLEALIERLKDRQFDLSTGAMLEMQKILSQLDGGQASSPQELKYVLAPVVCRNKEEQEDFHLVFDEYLAELAAAVAQKGKDRVEPGDAGKEKRKGWSKWVLGASIIIAYLFIGIVLYHRWHRPPPVPVNPPSLTISSSVTPIVRQPISLDVSIHDTLTAHRYSIDWLVDDTVYKDTRMLKKTFGVAGPHEVKATLTDSGRSVTEVRHVFTVLCEDPPSVEVRPDSRNAGDRMTYHAEISHPAKDTGKYRFFWYINDSLVKGERSSVTVRLGSRLQPPYTVRVTVACNGLHCSKDSLPASFREALLLSLKATTANNIPTPPAPSRQPLWGHILLWGIWSLIAPFLIIASFFYFFNRDWTLETGPTGPFAKPYRIDLSPMQQAPVNETTIRRLADILRKRQATDGSHLNVPLTIRKTIQNAGFPSLFFSPRTQPTDFLFLIEKQDGNSHLLRLYEHLAASLKKQEVELKVYTYYKEPLLLNSPALHHHHLPIDRVAGLYPGTILFLFTDADSLFSPFALQLKEWVPEKFRPWETKFIFTPTPLADWGRKEAILKGAGFTVIPADSDGHSLVEEEINRLIFQEPARRRSRRSSYSLKDFQFGEPDHLERYLLAAAAQTSDVGDGGLRHRMIRQWLYSLSVYPRLDWKLTVAIGKALEKRYTSQGICRPGQLVNYSNLLLLSRIVWMQTGQWSHPMRLYMMEQLEADTEIVARATLLNLLIKFGKENKVTKDSLVDGELRMHQTVNRFLLSRHDPDTYHLTKKEYRRMRYYIRHQLVDWPTDKRYQGIPGKYIRVWRPRLTRSVAALGFLCLAGVSILFLGTSARYPWYGPVPLSTTRFILAKQGLAATGTISGPQALLGGSSYPVSLVNDTLLVRGLPERSIDGRSGPTYGIMRLSVTIPGQGPQLVSTTFTSGFGEYGLVLSVGNKISRPVIKLSYNDAGTYSAKKDKIDSALAAYELFEPDRADADTVSRLTFSAKQRPMADSVAKSIKDVFGIDLKLFPVTNPGPDSLPRLHLGFVQPQTWTASTIGDLPAGLFEIWGLAPGSRKLTFRPNGVLDYAIDGTSVSVEYKMNEFYQKGNNYKLIVWSSGSYFVFMVRWYAKFNNFTFYDCLGSYKTIQEARKAPDPDCAGELKELYYESSPVNRFYYPLGNGSVYPDNRVALMPQERTRLGYYLLNADRAARYRLLFGFNTVNIAQYKDPIGRSFDTALHLTQMRAGRTLTLAREIANRLADAPDAYVSTFTGSPFDRDYVELVPVPANAPVKTWQLIRRIYLDSNDRPQTAYLSFIDEVLNELRDDPEARIKLRGYYAPKQLRDTARLLAQRSLYDLQSYLQRQLAVDSGNQISVELLPGSSNDSLRLDPYQGKMLQLDLLKRQSRTPTSLYIDIFGLNLNKNRLDKIKTPQIDP